MMDTWWNEAIEQQAIDRVHRLGQNKPVFVTRYIIKGTVEKRIMKIRESVWVLTPTQNDQRPHWSTLRLRAARRRTRRHR
jgi:SNF2 family DNA or RNA helicase